MNPNVEIVNELKELNSFLATTPKANVFVVPGGYFETVADNLLMFVKEENSIIKNSPEPSFLQVPAEYFDNLAIDILTKIKNQSKENADSELRILSPMLYSIQNENVFEVPNGYFNSISDDVIKQVAPGKRKLTLMRTRNLFIKYAAAAVVFCFVTFSIFKFTEKNNSSAKAQFAIKLDPAIEHGKSMNNAQFDTTLNNLSQDDIASYLEKNGNESDIAELSSNIDGNNLPNEDDYILDQTTLEKYLGDGNAKQTNN